jgi:hypothetical protein
MRATATRPLSTTCRELAISLVAAQRLLDRSYRQTLASFAESYRLLTDAGHHGLARQVAPSRYYLAEGEITVRVSLSSAKQRGFGLHARLINLGFERRFSHTEMSRATFVFSLRQVSAGHPSGTAPHL